MSGQVLKELHYRAYKIQKKAIVTEIAKLAKTATITYDCTEHIANNIIAIILTRACIQQQ